MRVRAIAVAVGLTSLLALEGCGSAGTNAAAAADAPVSTVPSGCASLVASQLSLPQTQGRYEVFSITNKGSLSCTLLGYPTVQIITPHGPLGGMESSGAGISAGLVQLQPGDAASFWFQVSSCSPDVVDWPGSYSYRLGLPEASSGALVTLNVNFDPSPGSLCQGEDVSVGPLVQGIQTIPQTPVQTTAPDSSTTLPGDQSVIPPDNG